MPAYVCLDDRHSSPCAHLSPYPSYCSTIPIVRRTRVSNQVCTSKSPHKNDPLPWAVALSSPTWQHVTFTLWFVRLCPQQPNSSIFLWLCLTREKKHSNSTQKTNCYLYYHRVAPICWTWKAGTGDDVRWMRKLCRRRHPSSPPPIAHPKPPFLASFSPPRLLPPTFVFMH